MADFEEITDGCPSGDGVFDELMSSVKAHLKEEYDNQRIRGSEYSQVYLGSLQSAMTQAIQWHLGAEIAANQALLIEKQIEGQEKQNLLLEEQRAQIIAQTDLIVQQRTNLEAEALNIPKQGILIDAQASKTSKEEALVDQRVLTEVHNTSAAEYNVTDMLPAQKARVDGEVAILDQKFVTEEAQTKTTTSQGIATGVVGAQVDLYKAQKEGFFRDAEQKASRIITDTWGISVSANTDAADTPGQVSPDNIDEVIEHLRVGANISGPVT